MTPDVCRCAEHTKKAYFTPQRCFTEFGLPVTYEQAELVKEWSFGKRFVSIGTNAACPA